MSLNIDYATLADALDHTAYNTQSDYVLSGGTFGQYSGMFNVDKDTTGKIARFYTTILRFNSTGSGAKTVKLNVDTGLRPSAKKTIIGHGFATLGSGEIQTINTTINTDGTIEISFYCAASGIYYINIYDTILFI